MSNKKKWWKSKTIWKEVLVTVAGIATFLAGQDIVKDNPQAVSLLLTVAGIIGVILRKATKEPI